MKLWQASSGFSIVLQLLQLHLPSAPLEKLHLVVFGQIWPPAQPRALGFSIHCSGPLHDDLRLRLLCGSTDLVVNPSRQDNQYRARAELLLDPVRVEGLYAQGYREALVSPHQPRDAETPVGLRR